jgi:hypothetical protein
MEGINLALMACRIGQNVGDDPPLVVRADGSVPPVLKGKFDLFLGPDLLPKMRADEPVSKEGRAQMRRGTPDQSKTRSETQWSRAAWLVTRISALLMSSPLEIKSICS